MAIFNNTDDLVKHVLTKTWNNGVSYTPKELGFPNNARMDADRYRRYHKSSDKQWSGQDGVVRNA
jgi:hypothetical protein